MNRFDPLRKLMHADEAVARFASQPGTVFTHGLFDALGRADVAFLAEARQLGDRLVVAIEGDAVARIRPGSAARPSRCEGDRAFQVAALESVDVVVICNDASPVPLLARLRPAVHVLRGDQDLNRLPETALLHSWGGHAIALPFAEDVSTASLAERVRGAPQPALGAR
jgi:rfaE bifunctional protein nucleotidyltransferase chain/domain